jgi:hypothetical protein
MQCLLNWLYSRKGLQISVQSVGEHVEWKMSSYIMKIFSAGWYGLVFQPVGLREGRSRMRVEHISNLWISGCSVLTALIHVYHRPSKKEIALRTVYDLRETWIPFFCPFLFFFLECRESWFRSTEAQIMWKYSRVRETVNLHSVTAVWTSCPTDLFVRSIVCLPWSP